MIGAVLILIWAGSAVTLIMLKLQLWEEVNGNLPPRERLPHWGPSYFGRHALALHKRFYPASRLRTKMYLCFCGGCISMIGAIACFARFN
jgi:hypothetical protein